MVSNNEMKMNWLDGQSQRRWYKTIYITLDEACIVTNLSDIDVLLTSHDYYDYLDYNAIKYLNNKNKAKYYCFHLHNYILADG